MADTEFKTRPILFNAEMVNALLAGNKTQTRRVIKPQPSKDMVRMHTGNPSEETVEALYELAIEAYKQEKPKTCPYGIPGDRLWVRETWMQGANGSVFYRANLNDIVAKWKPSIHMPRKFSRITLEIKDIRVERVQDISSADIVDEGIPVFFDGPKTAKIRPNPSYSIASELIVKAHRKKFIQLWDSINGAKYPWNSNCWVWVIEFEVINE